jgi:predicted short-subunit dehydrogenase-like oxidoreductase (DUF2520 family)
MRQVPHYLLIGNGRSARHFQHYFSLLHLSFSTWQRSESTEKLFQQTQQASHILVLIKDDAIEDFIREYLQSSSAIIVHCSGSLMSHYAYGAHPLTTFNQDSYTLEQYQAIPFILDHDAPAFENLFPGLSNKHAILNKNKKEKYHALCVLSGNFSIMLWQKIFSDFEKEFNFSHEIVQVYLQQCMKNLLTDPQTALTGPLVRNDYTTLEKNISALTHDPFQDVYKSFVKCYQKLRESETV